MTHELNQDLGGSGSNLRTPSCCLGRARCEWGCYDTQEACYQMTMEYQDELHRPAFPYKFKFKFDGCPNGCVAAIARSDMSVIGTWKDDIRIDQSAVKAYAGGELKPNAGAHAGKDWGKFDIMKEVVDLCPTGCMWWDGSKLTINNRECTRCMHCLNVMPRALRIGTETGASVLFGAKAPILEGAQMSTLTVPFLPMEEGKNRERLGELIQREGFQKFLQVCELEPDPRMVDEPRSNPYIFWREEEVEGGWTRDIKDYRAKHQR
jgi:sulfite reductase alpha subunit